MKSTAQAKGSINFSWFLLTLSHVPCSDKLFGEHKKPKQTSIGARHMEEEKAKWKEICYDFLRGFSSVQFIFYHKYLMKSKLGWSLVLVFFVSRFNWSFSWKRSQVYLKLLSLFRETLSSSWMCFNFIVNGSFKPWVRRKTRDKDEKDFPNRKDEKQFARSGQFCNLFQCHKICTQCHKFFPFSECPKFLLGLFDCGSILLNWKIH